MFTSLIILKFISIDVSILTIKLLIVLLPVVSLSMIKTDWVCWFLVIFASEGQIESVFESIREIHSMVLLSKPTVNESPSGSKAVGSLTLIQSQAEILMFWSGCKYLGGSLENMFTVIVK